ncbi:MAG: c-type cytochrome [Burkholderiaceae bacterium]|nr:c-type cytochrome [Burkholderiaceae bacterium]
MRFRHKLIGAMLALAALGAIGTWVLYWGVYDVSARNQHLAPTYWLLDTGMRQSVKRHSQDIHVPQLDDQRLIRRGQALFREHCVLCHGAPGVAPQPFALGMTPAPGNLAHAARDWQPAELFWITKFGIKMAGMPAWEFRFADDDIWALVAFLRRLPRISPAEYRSLPAEEAQALPHPAHEPSAERGRIAMRQYLCVTCHVIPGIVGPNAPVGPTLDGIAKRAVIAGLLPNTPENMVRWLREPQRVNPDGAMPDLGVSERDAHDMAAFLQTLR